jgi:peptidyl-dipeptidase A
MSLLNVLCATFRVFQNAPCSFLGMAASLMIGNTLMGQEEPRSPKPDTTLVGLTADEQAQQFVHQYENQIRPIEIQAASAWWEANTTGSDLAYEKKQEAENTLNEALANRTQFEILKKLKGAEIVDPVLRRQIEVLYLNYLEKQVDPKLMREMTAKANAIEKAFNVFRATVNGKEMADSQVRKVLKESVDSVERRQVWEASKVVGKNVESDIRELVALRNIAAESLGFANFHAMQLNLNEQDPAEVLALFEELDKLTREPFRKAKEEIDQRLAAKYKLAVADLRPWHYHDPFFQEPPDVYDVDVDAVFAKVDIPAICKKFYAGIGLPIDDVLAKSDLYEKPGKSPHAFCTDIDREGDVRVLANIVPNDYWMTTMLHELGHSVYSSKFIPKTLPYVLRTEAHILSTEGMAMMFERFAGYSQWLKAMGVPVNDPPAYDAACQIARRNKLLIFSRWCQVMLRFEMEMYRNPNQDLNALWWSMVEKYQQIQCGEPRNAPDYASKIHVVSAPAYYHNYMMGELFACQLHAAITREVLKEDNPQKAIYFDRPEVGEFITDKVFTQGALRDWNDLTEFATGSRLIPQAFAAEFGNSPSEK